MRQSNTAQKKGNIQQNRTVYKTRQYALLRRMIKEGKYTSVRMSARALGVRPETIQSWLKTPAILRLIAEEMDSYVSEIKKSKDWKAKAYLIDKLIGKEIIDAGIGTHITIVNNDREFSISSSS